MATKMIAIKYLVALLLGFLTIHEQHQLQEKAPGLRALDNYVGTWDSEFTIDSNGDSSSKEKFTGKVEAKWTVGGRFLEQTGTYILDKHSTPLVIKTLMTFDVNDQKYNYHFFDSSGEHAESTGKWDAATKTMTSKMSQDDGSVMKTTANFSRPGIETWTIEITDPDKTSTTKITGKNTRRKK